MHENTSGRERKKRRARGRLGRWMASTNTSAADLARKLKIARSSVYGLRDRALTPGLALAVRLEKVTGIPVTYWGKNRKT